jgi:hypothetical protein
MNDPLRDDKTISQKKWKNPLLKGKKAMALAMMQGEKRSVFYCTCANGPQHFKQIEFWQ